MTKKTILFAVAIEYDDKNDSDICPDSMRDNLQALVETGSQKGELTPTDMDSDVQYVKVTREL